MSFHKNLFAAVALGALSLAGAAAAQNAGPLRIGVLTEESGP